MLQGRYFVTDPETGKDVLAALRQRFDGDKRLSCNLVLRQSFGHPPEDGAKECFEYFAYTCLTPNAGSRGTVYLYSLVHVADEGEGTSLFTVLIDHAETGDQTLVTDLLDFLESLEFAPAHESLRPRPPGPVSCPSYLEAPIDTASISQWLRGHPEHSIPVAT